MDFPRSPSSRGRVWTEHEAGWSESCCSDPTSPGERQEGVGLVHSYSECILDRQIDTTCPIFSPRKIQAKVGLGLFVEQEPNASTGGWCNGVEEFFSSLLVGYGGEGREAHDAQKAISRDGAAVFRFAVNQL